MVIKLSKVREKIMSAAVLAGSKKEQIKELLKNNCAPSDVALAVGCEPSYVSQLLQDQDFAAEVAVARIQILKEQSDRDGKYDSLEDKLLQGLEMKLEQGVAFLKIETILRAIQTVNQAKRRGAPVGGPSTVINNVINLNLPAHTVREFSVSGENEVIAVGSQALVSMAASQVLNKLQSKALARVEPINKNDKVQDVKDIFYDQAPEQSKIARRIEAATISAATV